MDDTESKGEEEKGEEQEQKKVTRRRLRHKAKLVT